MNVYDAGGARIRKTNLLNNISTFYPVAGYEQTGSAVTKHYSFNGVPVAVRDGSGLFFLYQDGVSSNVYVTNAWGSVVGSRGCYAFGELCYSNGAMPTDRRYIRQWEDTPALSIATWHSPWVGRRLPSANGSPAPPARASRALSR